MPRPTGCRDLLAGIAPGLSQALSKCSAQELKREGEKRDDAGEKVGGYGDESPPGAAKQVPRAKSAGCRCNGKSRVVACVIEP